MLVLKHPAWYTHVVGFRVWWIQSRCSSCLHMSWWWVALRLFWHQGHSISTLIPESRKEKINYSNLKYNLGLLWFGTSVRTHLVLYMIWVCPVLLLLGKSSRKQVRSGGSQSWWVQMMAWVGKEASLSLFFLFHPSNSAPVCGRKWVF